MLSKMLKVAITGGAGSGKSTVARMFQELGAVVLDADDIARQVTAPGQPAWEAMQQAFGPAYFEEDGTINRPALARRVFKDPSARAQLEVIVHPAISRVIARRLQELEDQNVPLVMVEVPLLFETGRSLEYQKIIVVYVDFQDQVKRLKDRDSREQDEIIGILEAQMPLRDKCARADYVVDNRGELSQTKKQIEGIWQDLKKLLDKEGKKR